MRVLSLTIIPIMFATSALAADKVANVSVKETGEIIEVQSEVDELIVNDVVINRGNCVVLGEKDKKLKFGETATFLSYPPPVCKIIEISVMTSRGTINVKN